MKVSNTISLVLNITVNPYKIRIYLGANPKPFILYFLCQFALLEPMTDEVTAFGR